MHAATAIHIPFPKTDRLFVDWWVYSWRGWDEYAMAAWNLQRMDEAIWANFQILSNTKADGYPLKRILDNITHCCKPADKFDDLRLMWQQVQKNAVDSQNRTIALVQKWLKDRSLRKFERLIMGAISR